MLGSLVSFHFCWVIRKWVISSFLKNFHQLKPIKKCLFVHFFYDFMSVICFGLAPHRSFLLLCWKCFLQYLDFCDIPRHHLSRKKKTDKIKLCTFLFIHYNLVFNIKIETFIYTLSVGSLLMFLPSLAIVIISWLRIDKTVWTKVWASILCVHFLDSPSWKRLYLY